MGGALEPAVLPLFANGLNIVKGLLPEFTPLVTGAAGALGVLEEKSAKALGSPVWTQFVATVGQGSGPRSSGSVIALGHVATGAMGVVSAVLRTPAAAGLPRPDHRRISPAGARASAAPAASATWSARPGQRAAARAHRRGDRQGRGLRRHRLAPLGGTALSVDARSPT